MSLGGERSEAEALRTLIAGYEAAQAIDVAAKLGIADHVGDAGTSSRELAQLTGAHEVALHRVLRALAASRDPLPHPRPGLGFRWAAPGLTSRAR